MLKPTDLLQKKDGLIKYRCPEVVQRALDKAAEKHGIRSSKLALYVMTQFLSMDGRTQKRFLKGELKAGTVRAEIVKAKKSSNKDEKR